MTCCASPGWAAQVASGRPYQSVGVALAASAAALAGQPWSEIEAALSAHPRIGERAAGESADAAMSRREQAAVSDAQQSTRAEIAEANQAYEDRFGHIYLVFASGRGADELLAEARRRLANEPDVERAEVRRELGRITTHRLAAMLE